MHPWPWVPFFALALLLAGQQLRIFHIRRQAKKREELFQLVAENAADMIALVDVKGRRLYNSPAYKRILGYSAAELGETSAFEQIHEEDRFKILEAAREARETGTGKRLEYRIRHKDGSWRVLESIASAIRDSSGSVAKLVIVNRDITERKRAEQQLEHNLYHDPLTGLPNRRLFLDRLEHSFARSPREPGHSYSLLLANIDHFKAFNETLGTAGGDHVLQEVSRRCTACLRQNDSLARHESSIVAVLSRVGGDEFTTLLDSVSDPGDAMRIARRLQAAAAEPFLLGERQVCVSISVGIAIATSDHKRPEDILKDATTALRRAKAMGGSRCEVFDEAMHTRAEGRMRLEAELRDALEKRQFRIFYQPVVDLNTQRVVSLESLLRWEHPQQGLVSPYHFIEAAEDTGILVSLGYWMLLQSCRQLREWDVLYPAEPVNITVNVSARQFADARFVINLQEALRETGIDPARLQLELPENVVSADPKLAAAILPQLKQLGIGAIIDDFVGASSLSAVRQFPFETLKIDRSLVREMQVDRAAAQMVEMVVTLARKLNLKIIGEGIETARQVEQLRQLGCGFGQGYYFSQPLEAKQVLQFLQRPAGSRTRSAASG